MSYSSATVAETIAKINTEYLLPAIQRPFVWGPEKMVELFDSLMKGYPISSFLLWRVEPQNQGNWQIYEFAEHFRQGDVHNVAGKPKGEKLTLVLDGQQRLTSLFIGLRGSFTVKGKGKRWTSSDAWQRKTLFIDLLVDPALIPKDEHAEDDIEHSYGFALFQTPPQSGPANLWLSVSEILRYPERVAFDAFVEKTVSGLPQSSNWMLKETARRNLQRLYNMVWVEKIICHYTEEDQDYDRVLGIFVRANDAGTKLSKSDLMLSMISSHWSDLSAREEIFNFVDTINDRLDRKNNISKDFVMKSCLLLSDLDHIYRVKNFNNRNLEIMRSNWPSIKISLRRTFLLVNSFGIDRDNLIGMNAILPIAYYLHKIDADLLSASTPFAVSNAERIRRWLIAALLNGVFSGHSDNTIAVAKTAIAAAIKSDRDFPAANLNAALSKAIKRPSYLTGEALLSALEMTYTSKQIFLLLSLIYENKAWGSTPYQIDHIFPQSRLDRRQLMKNNVPSSKIDELVACANRVGNLQLLAGAENVEKSNQTFEDWIRTRDSSFMEKHCIPEDELLWSVQMAPRFVAAREKLILARLEKFQGDSRFE
jgi:uncharacterized protein with ParB-like and HNH nuclease domain